MRECKVLQLSGIFFLSISVDWHFMTVLLSACANTRNFRFSRKDQLQYNTVMRPRYFESQPSIIIIVRLPYFCALSPVCNCFTRFFFTFHVLFICIAATVSNSLHDLCLVPWNVWRQTKKIYQEFYILIYFLFFNT